MAENSHSEINWHEINIKEDKASTQGTHAFRYLVQRLHKAQHNPSLRPMVQDLMFAYDMVLTLQGLLLENNVLHKGVSKWGDPWNERSKAYKVLLKNDVPIVLLVELPRGEDLLQVTILLPRVGEAKEVVSIEEEGDLPLHHQVLLLLPTRKKLALMKQGQAQRLVLRDNAKGPTTLESEQASFKSLRREAIASPSFPSMALMVIQITCSISSNNLTPPLEARASLSNPSYAT